MKRITACLLALMLVLALAVPVQAALEYKLLYDATEVFDRDMCWEIGAEQLPALSDTYKTQIRIDIVNSTEEFTTEEYAELFYMNFDYGYGEAKDCILLMLHMNADDTGAALVNYAVYCGGESKETLDGFLTLVEPHLGSHLKEEVWAGDAEADNQALKALAEAYTVCAEGFLSGELEPIIPEPVTKSGFYIVDDTDLMTDDEWVALEAEAKEASLKHNIGIYVAVVENFADDGSASALEAAQSRYKAKRLGRGLDKDGVLLLISMDKGHYAIFPNGSSTQWIQDQQVGELSDILLDKFASGVPVKGLSDYVRYCDTLFSGEPGVTGETQEPEEAAGSSEGSSLYVPIVLVICAVLIVLIFREQRRNAKPKEE